MREERERRREGEGGRRGEWRGEEGRGEEKGEREKVNSSLLKKIKDFTTLANYSFFSYLHILKC